MNTGGAIIFIRVSRYLLVAAAQCCLLVCNAQPQFKQLTPEKTNILFTNKLLETPADNIITYEYFYNGGGVAVADFNNDGLTDIYFTANQQPNALYLNKGKLVFEDVTKAAGVAGKNGWKTGVTVADVNGDGWMDIYVCYSGNVDPSDRQNQLFMNNENGTFTEKAKEMGLADEGYSTQAAFFDYDQDGDLDMIVINHNVKQLRNFDAAFVKKMVDADAGDRLYRNDNNRFTDVTLQAGIISNPLGYGLGINIADINKDGWPDVYITNDYVEEDYLYLNNKNGTFKECLKDHLGHISNFSMGVDIADVNNDGNPDIFTLDMLPETNKRQKLLYAPDNYELYKNTLQNGFHHQLMRNMLQVNNGNGTFSEVGQLAGVSNTDWSWAALLADFTNDGYKDLFVTNGYGRDMINMDFMKFYANERLKFNRGEKSDRMFQMLRGIQSTPLHNYFFENDGNLHFANRFLDNGFDEPDFSHGAAYADFDNDGDLDLVVNRMNEVAGIYINQCNILKKDNHYLNINLRMKGANTYALGAKLTVYSKGKINYLENYPVHGFQSAMQVPLHIGLSTKTIDSINIIWHGNRMQTIIKNIPVDTTITIYPNDFKPNYPAKVTSKPIFAKAGNSVDFKHHEEDVNDFKVQPLMPGMISYAGPHFASTDLNNDKLTDIFIGGGPGQAGAILLQLPNGDFIKTIQPAFDTNAESTDTDAIFFDADGDGRQDLYVVSGGYNYLEGDSAYQDRLYLNRNGKMVKAANAVPKETGAGCIVKAFDYDNDGDLDLFVGSRVVPGNYPVTPAAMLLQNDGKGYFTDVIKTAGPALLKAGMITDAAWTDLNKDGKKELIVCGDWMPIKVFELVNGILTDATNTYFSNPVNGWWNRMAIADLDNDGDLDMVAANWGTNSQLPASSKQPITLYYGDFDDNGYIDPLLCYYIDGKSFPMASRDELTDQMVSLRQKFPTYDSYSEATIENILTPEQLAKATILEATELQTVWFENKDGKFVKHSLPVQASYTPVYAILINDFDKDGIPDILLGGNVNETRIKIGRMDASFGVLLKGTGKANFSYVPQTQSGLTIQGCIKDLINIKSANNGQKVMAAINDNFPMLLEY